MFGFFIAAVSAAGLVLLARRRRHGFGGPFGRRGLYRFFQRLDTSPGQEKVIREAFADLREASRGAWTETRSARPELADLLRREKLDDDAIGSWFSARRSSLQDFETRFRDALRKVHDVLDERQRDLLADFIVSGPRFGWRHHHHHHQHHCC